MNQKPLKILFLATWYPNRYDAMLGLFVKRHAEAVSHYAKVIVVNVFSTDKIKAIYELETSVSNNITTIIIYTRRSKTFIKPLNTLINGLRYIKAQQAAWKILKATDSTPDITHVHILTRAGLVALFLKAKHKIPYLITEHWSRYLPHHGGYKGLLRKYLTKKVIENSAGVTTVSQALKEGMNRVGLTHSQWEIIPNVVDTSLFKPCPPDNNNHNYCFSHISCFEEQSKNMSGILKAAKILRDKGKEFEILMIGDGQDIEDNKTYSKKLGISNIIHYTGVLEGPELVKTMCQCNCSILFSNYETFAIVIPENIACGIPVIAPKVGGIPEVLPDKFGSLIAVGDINALAQEMESYIDKQHHFDTEAMIEYVEENYSYDEVGHRFFLLYQSALKRHSQEEE